MLFFLFAWTQTELFALEYNFFFFFTVVQILKTISVLIPGRAKFY